MAKKKKSEFVDVFGGDLDKVFNEIVENAEAYFGEGGIYLAKDSERRIVGLTLPSLAAKYLFQSTIFTLSRMTQLVGEQASFKSTFLYEIMRWHRAYGGRTVLLEAETKDSPEIRAAIMNYDEQAVIHRPCADMESWQEGMVYFIDKFQRAFLGTSSNPGPGRVAPICIGVDSLMGKACRETQKKVQKSGHAERGYALEANLISIFMKCMPQTIADWPFSIIGVNHRKPAVTPQGLPTGKVAGGMSLKFQETYELRLTKVKSFEKANYSGSTVQIRTDKNSLGPDRKKIDVDIIFWNDYDQERGLRQHALWDWYGASIKLLYSFKKQAGLFNRIMEICDIREGKKPGTAWSKSLGVPSDDPQPIREVGKLLEGRSDILSSLYPILGIRERMPFSPGIDYLDQMKQSSDISRIREATLENVNLLEDPRQVGVSYFSSDVENAEAEIDNEETPTDNASDDDSFDPDVDL